MHSNVIFYRCGPEDLNFPNPDCKIITPNIYLPFPLCCKRYQCSNEIGNSYLS